MRPRELRKEPSQSLSDSFVNFAASLPLHYVFKEPLCWAKKGTEAEPQI